jgi:hypothetical protein
MVLLPARGRDGEAVAVDLLAGGEGRHGWVVTDGAAQVLEEELAVDG